MDDIISVVITTYRRPLLILKRAIDSVVQQDYKNIEIMVVNDYPEDKDNSEAIQKLIKNYNDVKISYISYEHNRGACAARNEGIKNAHGKFIALLDDDDEWTVDKLSSQLRGFTSEEIGMVYSPYYEIDSKVNGEIICECQKSGSLVTDLLWKNVIGGSSMTLVRSEVYRNCGGFDEHLLASQDYDMWLRIAEKYLIAYIEEPTVKRYLSDDSITQNYTKKLQGWECFMQKHQELYQSHPDILNYRYAKMAGYCIEHNDFDKAKELILAAFNFGLSKYNFTEPAKGFIKYVFQRVKDGK